MGCLSNQQGDDIVDSSNVLKALWAPILPSPFSLLFVKYGAIIYDIAQPVICTVNGKRRLMFKSFFLHSEWKEAFNVVEIELTLVFDSFYTKAAIHYTRWGRILRLITESSTLVTLAAYYYSQKHKYSEVNVNITYTLLVGAVSLEIFGMVVWLCSDWALIWLDHHEKMPVMKIY